MKRLLMAAVLACALSVSALAGEVPTDGSASPQPPDAATQTTTVTAPGDVPTDSVAEQETDSTLAALLGILSLLVF